MQQKQDEAALVAVATKVQEVLSTRDAIKNAITQTTNELNVANGNVEQARIRLGDETAAAMLKNATVPPASAKGLATAAQVQDAVLAKLDGLARLITRNNADILAVETELGATRSAYVTGWLAEYEGELAEACAEFAKVLRRGYAFATSLEVDYLVGRLRDFKVENLVTGGPIPLIHLRGDLPSHADEPAGSEPDIRALKYKLTGITRQIRQQESDAAEKAQRDRVNSSYRPVTVITHPETRDEKVARAEELIAAHSSADLIVEKSA